MGEHLKIESDDGFELGVYMVRPKGIAKGGILVIQEIFGVNGHIREVADGYADQGYLVVAPKIFDRVDQDIELGYEETDMGKGVELAFQKLNMEQTLLDLQASINLLKSEVSAVGVVGYCFGGLLTWLSACTLEQVDAAVSYYGGGVANQLDKQARCPVMMHFGELDAHIPLTDVEKVRNAQPAVQLFTYDADHGFNCDHRGSYDEVASNQARQRTLDFFDQYLTQ